MPLAEAGDVGVALRDRPGSSRMAKADPRWKREVPRRLPLRRGVEGLPAAAECGATLRKPPVAFRGRMNGWQAGALTVRGRDVHVTPQGITVLPRATPEPG
jgi:hypothetical protein